MVERGILDRLPSAADAWCVIDVADSSYEPDSGEKLQSYAMAAVQQYVIINLRNQTAEVYSNPNTASGTYPPPRVVPVDDLLPIRVGETEYVNVPLAELMP